VEPEEMDSFEKELQQALQRRPAPPSLKRKVMERRGRQSAERRHSHLVLWERLAASLVLAAALGGAAKWELNKVEDRRKGEDARRQVMTALRITGHALNEMNTRLAAHDRGAE
jgi:hypothetical protein